MAEKKSTFEMIRLGIVLAIYAACACTVLALVNNLTSPVIAANKLAKANAAMKVVLPAAEEFSPVADFAPASNPSVTVQSVYVAKAGGKSIGAVAQVSGPTYDKGTIMVGMLSDGTVTGLQFLELTDSPGFGLKANDPTFVLPSGKTFYGQFEGMNARDGFVAGSTFDSISGATITSVGVAELVSQGAASMLSYFEKTGE